MNIITKIRSWISFKLHDHKEEHEFLIRGEKTIAKKTCKECDYEFTAVFAKHKHPVYGYEMNSAIASGETKKPSLSVYRAKKFV